MGMGEGGEGAADEQKGGAESITNWVIILQGHLVQKTIGEANPLH